jgi:hypothetical protein
MDWVTYAYINTPITTEILNLIKKIDSSYIEGMPTYFSVKDNFAVVRLSNILFHIKEIIQYLMSIYSERKHYEYLIPMIY